MKRKTALWAIVVAAVAFVSCLRDDDLNLLKHPIHVVGEATPGLGAPIGYGEMNVSDIITMLSDSYRGHLRTSGDTVAIFIDTTVADTLRHMAESSAPSTFLHNAVFAKDGSIGKDTTITYGLDLPIFEDAAVDSLLYGHITISHLLITLQTHFKVECPDTAKTVITNYAEASVKDLHVYYTGHGGQQFELGQDKIPFDSTSISRLLEGDSVIADHSDMSDIINRLPTHVEVSYKLHFKIKSDFFTDHAGDDNFNDMLDSISQLYFHYQAHLSAEMPLSMKIDALPYNIAIDFSNDSLTRLDLQSVTDSISRGLEVHIDSAHLTLAFTNGLPIAFTLSAALLDENGTAIGDSILRDQTILSSTTVATDATGTCYHTQSPTLTNVTLHLDENLIRDLHKARKLNLRLRVCSSPSNGVGRDVLIGPDDFLGVKTFIQIHPSAKLDMRLTNSGIIN